MFEGSQEKNKTLAETLAEIEEQFKSANIYLDSIRITDPKDASKLMEEISDLKIKRDELKNQIEAERLSSQSGEATDVNEEIAGPDEIQPVASPQPQRKITTRYSGGPYDAAKEDAKKEAERRRAGEAGISKLKDILSE